MHNFNSEYINSMENPTSVNDFKFNNLIKSCNTTGIAAVKEFNVEFIVKWAQNLYKKRVSDSSSKEHIVHSCPIVYANVKRLFQLITL